MTVVHGPDDLRTHFPRASTEALRAFGDGTLYLEPYIERARHIEVQILADTHGNVCHLGERDCSAQRRYQKLVEEAPSVGLDPELVDAICGAAIALARGLDYVGAGTVEFLVDVQRQAFIFLEVNARVQVEHPVTEEVTGIDIVREQLNIARGRPLGFRQEDVAVRGHSIECRINAEDARNGFMPTPGPITRWTPPHGTGVRIETASFEGAVVPPYYDSLIAKLIVHAADRPAAVTLMERALARLTIEGVHTTIELHQAIMGDATFRSSPITTKWLEESFLPTWEKKR
jgi:acetyl-CoA carboxylase biotin carboxylase subunit